MNNQNVVLGASGGLGNAVVRKLTELGRKVRAVNRSGKIDVPAGVETLSADVTNPEDVLKVCEGASVIYHCVNVPYFHWKKKLHGITDNIIQAAEKENALLVYGDNLYMYGYVDGKISENLPHSASGEKGKIRAEVAKKFLDAHKSGRIKVVTGRGPDFYGPHANNALLGERTFIPALKGKTVNLIGDVTKKHTYIYIDDFARGLVMLADDETTYGDEWIISSAETKTTKELLDLISEKINKPIKLRTAGKVMVSFFGLFSPLMRELKEMMYQWENDYVVDHSKFQEHFVFEPTSHDEAIEKTIEWFKDNMRLN